MSQFQLVSNGEAKTITVFEDGEVFSVDNTHPNFEGIVAAAIAGDPVKPLIDVSDFVEQKFNKITDRVSISGGVVYLDNDPIHNALANKIIEFEKEGLSYLPLVKFFDKVIVNPNEHSREQLFSWLERNKFTIDKDGDIVMFKGVQSADANGKYASIHQGPAIVNGEAVEHLKQAIGDVVEMPRSQVNHDPTQGCSTGLHASSFDYAKSFGRVVLTVKVNPGDVVSVPTDCDFVKVRCCRYTITGVTEFPIERPLLEEEWSCLDCGELLEDEDDVCECQYPGYDEEEDDEEEDW